LGYEPPLTLADILMSESTLHEEKPRRIRLSLRKVMDSRILSQSTTSSDSVFCLSECTAIDMALPTRTPSITRLGEGAADIVTSII